MNNLVGFLIFFGLVTIIFACIFLPNESQVQQVDCYDRFSNKILNQTCEDEVVGLPLSGKWFLFGFVELFFIGLSLCICPFWRDK